MRSRYETCFNKWYAEKFLQGQFTQECGAEFALYRECVEVRTTAASHFRDVAWHPLRDGGRTRRMQATLKERKLDRAVQEAKSRSKLQS